MSVGSSRRVGRQSQLESRAEGSIGLGMNNGAMLPLQARVDLRNLYLLIIYSSRSSMQFCRAACVRFCEGFSDACTLTASRKHREQASEKRQGSVRLNPGKGEENVTLGNLS
jgi:hypothetical protein